MFKFLPAMSAIDESQRVDAGMVYNDQQANASSWQSPTLLMAALAGTLFLTGCQQSDTQPVPENTQPTEKTAAEDSKPMKKSDSAAARIEQFQPIYVVQAQNLQRRLQAEYESLQAADTSDSENSLLTDPAAASNGAANDAEMNANTNNNIEPSVAPNTAIDSETGLATEEDINTSTEVGERDLTVLKRISLEPRKPTMLTEDQIIDRYQQVMDALYQPVTTPLTAEEIDTLIDVATLVPQLFEHAEIAGRVSAKSPALARLIIQHQVWEQIQAQQIVDMQQMKVDQQKEFETLMNKFNDTIQGYDEQIAKYEQTLRQFQ
ncbi:hypothetical protein ACTXJ2_10595 [Psychrobacter alimentarius]|uniref:hypothetical protein n=1 Tax=Psychrobacter TaxID=497 RepID=UPI000BAADBBF|nr:hypothetical protein [Psychrobacter sp. JB193]PAT65024.1 hypothetical protein CIK80_06765 [Psychrobacter sp. JB193]